MSHQKSKQPRVLAIAPTTRGVGFAILDAGTKLCDWGMKRVGSGDKNAQSLAKIEKLITLYTPGVIAAEDAAAEGSRRAPRIRELCEQVKKIAGEKGIRLLLLPRAEVQRRFFKDDEGTKHDLAQMLAKWFPDELAFRVPPVRKAWMSEDGRMGMFQAVALALTSSHVKTTKGRAGCMKSFV